VRHRAAIWNGSRNAELKGSFMRSPPQRWIGRWAAYSESALAWPDRRGLFSMKARPATAASPASPLRIRGPWSRFADQSHTATRRSPTAHTTPSGSTKWNAAGTTLTSAAIHSHRRPPSIT
jgi:hypothetical protein